MLEGLGWVTHIPGWISQATELAQPLLRHANRLEQPETDTFTCQCTKIVPNFGRMQFPGRHRSFKRVEMPGGNNSSLMRTTSDKGSQMPQDLKARLQAGTEF